MEAPRSASVSPQELDAFSDIDWGYVSYVEQGDAFADEWYFTGTHTGPFRLPDGTELPQTGKRVELHGMELVEAPRREDRRRQPLLRQSHDRGAARSRPRIGRDDRVSGGATWQRSTMRRPSSWRASESPSPASRARRRTTARTPCSSGCETAATTCSHQPQRD